MKSGIFEHLSKLQVFAHIVESGSIATGAQMARLTQPTASHLIKTLEKAIGSEVLIRSSRGIKLTDVGIKVYEFAKKLSGDVTNLEHDIALLESNQNVHIKIGTKETYAVSIFPKILNDLQLKAPQLSVTLNSSRLNKDLLSKLKNGSIDAALMPDPGDYEDVIGYEVFRERFGVYEACHLRSKQKKSNSHVESQKTIFTYGQGLTGDKGRWLKDIIEEAELSSRFTFVENYHMARAMMLHGLGLALLPVSFACVDVELKLVRSVLLEGFEQLNFGIMKTCFCFHRKNMRNKTLRSILTSVKESCTGI